MDKISNRVCFHSGQATLHLLSEASSIQLWCMSFTAIGYSKQKHQQRRKKLREKGEMRYYFFLRQPLRAKGLRSRRLRRAGFRIDSKNQYSVGPCLNHHCNSTNL